MISYDDVDRNEFVEEFKVLKKIYKHGKKFISNTQEETVTYYEEVEEKEKRIKNKFMSTFDVISHQNLEDLNKKWYFYIKNTYCNGTKADKIRDNQDKWKDCLKTINETLPDGAKIISENYDSFEIYKIFQLERDKINEVLKNDITTILKNYIDIIGLMNKEIYLNRTTYEEITCYRGYGVHTNDVTQLKNAVRDSIDGKYFCVPQYISASKNNKLKKVLEEKKLFYIEIIVPKNCSNGCEINKLIDNIMKKIQSWDSSDKSRHSLQRMNSSSNIENYINSETLNRSIEDLIEVNANLYNEEEVLFPPYTFFTILGQGENFLKLKVAWNNPDICKIIAPDPKLSKAEKFIKNCDFVDVNDHKTNLIKGPLTSKYGFMPSRHPSVKFSCSENSQLDKLVALSKNLHIYWKENKVTEKLKEIKYEEIKIDSDQIKNEEYPFLNCLLGNLAHAFHHNQNYKKEKESLPESFLNIWEAVSEKMDRKQYLNVIDYTGKTLERKKEVNFAYLSYNDIIHYNWRIEGKKSLEDYKPDEIYTENKKLSLLVSTLETAEEKNFYLAQIEMAMKSSKLVLLAAQAQSSVINNDKWELKFKLKEMNVVLRDVLDAFKKISPNYKSKTLVDPLEWARGIASLAVPFRETIKKDQVTYGKIQGPNGFGSPFTHLLDIFLKRIEYNENFGKEAILYRKSFPIYWQQYFTKLEEVNVRQYVKDSNDEELKSIFWELETLHSGDHSWLETHMLKLYTYLELAFKTGREVTIGGLKGFIKERNWNKDGHELSLVNLERTSKEKYFKNSLRIKDNHKHGLCSIIELEKDKYQFPYTSGDHIAIMPENSEELISKTLKALGCIGDEVVTLTAEKYHTHRASRSQLLWQENLKYRDEITNNLIEEVPLTTILKYGRLRNVKTYQAKLLALLAPNDFLRRNSQKEIELEKYELWQILEKCQVNTDPPLKDRLLYPGEEFQEQMYFSIIDLIEPETYRYYSIASSPKEETLKIIVSKLQYDVKISENLIKQKGSASNYLNRLKIGDSISLRIIHNPFLRLPIEKDVPIIMIAGGVGVSPMRSFIIDRINQKAKKNYLYFSTQSFENIYFYNDLYSFPKDSLKIKICLSHPISNSEISDAEGRLEGRIDVALSNDKDLLKKLIFEENACIYICGRNEFASTVYKNIFEIFKSKFDSDNTLDEQSKIEKVNLEINERIANKRFCIDAFSSYRNLEEIDKKFTISEIVKSDKCLIIINQYVYDLTDFKYQHHGGHHIIDLYKGMDATEAFNFIKHSKSPQIMSKASMYIIGCVEYPFLIDCLKEVYTSWKEYLFLIVELKNAWEKDTEYYNNIEDDDIFRYNEMIKTHSRFIGAHLPTIFGDKIIECWDLVIKVLNKYSHIKTQFDELDLKKKIDFIQKQDLNKINFDNIVSKLNSSIIEEKIELSEKLKERKELSKKLKTEQRFMQELLNNIVNLICEGIEIFETKQLKSLPSLPQMLNIVHHITKKYEIFYIVFIRIWKNIQTIREDIWVKNQMKQKFFYNSFEDGKGEIICEGLGWPHNLKPAIIYKQEGKFKDIIIEFNRIDGTYQLSNYENNSFLITNNDLFEKKGKFVDLGKMTVEFRSKFKLLVPESFDRCIWAYQLDVKEEYYDRLFEIYKNAGNLNHSNEDQIKRFFLYGSFIFFTGEELTNDNIVGTCTVDFPVNYDAFDNEFNTLLFNYPKHIFNFSDIVSKMKDVTIPFLRENKAYKYEVHNEDEGNNISFRYLLEHDNVKSLIYFDFLKTSNLKIISEQECILNNRNHYNIIY